VPYDQLDWPKKGSQWEKVGVSQKLIKINQAASHYCCKYLGGFWWNYGWYL